MAKIWLRLSVEIEVTDEQMEKLVEMSREDDRFYDVDVCDIEDFIDVTKSNPSDWDSDGYIPGDWLESAYKEWKEERK